MYSKKYVIGPSDADQNLNAKLSTIFIYLQDVAMEHAEELGIGKNATIDKNLMWVITRYSLTIKRMPKYLEEVTVSTYAGNDMKYIFPRYYNIKDAKGDIIITASATWLVLNKGTHSINFNPFDGKILPYEHYEGEEPLPNKLNPIDSCLIDKRKVRNSDVDINNHLNNTRYIEYLTDCHDFDYYKKRKIKHIALEYKKEIKNGQLVEIYSNSSNPEYIEAKVDDQTCFQALIDYE